MSSSGFLPEKRPLIGRPDKLANQKPVLWQETTLTPVMTLISEKTDFSTKIFKSIHVFKIHHEI